MSVFKIPLDVIEAEPRLTKAEIELLLQSLDYTRQAMERYAYPTITLKKQRLDEIETLRSKLINQKKRTE